MANNSYTFNSKQIFLSLLVISVTVGFLNIGLDKLMSLIDSNYGIAKSLSSSSLPNDSNIKVLFMGDSRTHQGVDPRLFDAYINQKKASYNLGRPGMQGPFYFFILNNLLIHTHTKPKAIFIQLSYYLLGGMDWFKDIYQAYYSPTLSEVIEASEEKLLSFQEAIKWYIITKIPSIKFRKKLQGIRENLCEGTLLKSIANTLRTYEAINHQSNRGYMSRGFSHITPEEAKAAQIKKCPLTIHYGYSMYLNFIKRFFELAAENGIYVIFYQFPYANETDTAELRECLSHYTAIIKDLAKNNNFIIFNEAAKFYDYTHFVDPLHLNHVGTIRLTKELAQIYQALIPSQKDMGATA